jgi:malonate transporter and related proteins
MSFALLLLPDFRLIAGGAALKRMRGFDAAFWAGTERLVYFMLFPALLFRSLATSPLGFADAGRLAAVGLTFTLAGMLLSALAQPLFRLPRATFAACFQCGFRFNTYIALAVASRIGGEPAIAAISVLVGVLVPAVNIAAVGMLARGNKSRIVIELGRNPLVLACLAGMLWRATTLPLPALASHMLGLLASAAVPLGLLAVGAGLTFAAGTLPPLALAWWNGIKLVALPAMALLLAHGAGLSPLERQVAVAMAAVPTATSAYILATQMNGQGAPVALLISTGTLLAAVTLPLWIAVVA